MTAGLLVMASTLILSACGGKDDPNPGGADVLFGDTAAVVIVNPTPNEGNTGTVPTSLGDVRGGVAIDAEPGGDDVTDPTGLAVVGLEPGPVNFVFDGGAVLPWTVTSEGDVYDVAVAYDGDTVTLFENFPIRYGIGGEIHTFATDAPAADIALALDTDGNVVFFEDGIFVGDLEITGDDVLFFGEGFTERAVVIDGSVTVRGTGVRIRGFTITGGIAVFGNDFGMAYTVVQGSTQINGNAVAFLRNALCGDVTVPSSNASLLDNEGMAPLPDPSPEVCSRPADER